MTGSLRRELWIFDRQLHRSIDMFYIALLRGAEKTLLPELYEVLGKDALLDVIDRFAGVTVTFPSKDVLRKAVEDTMMYLDHRSGQFIESLAQKYERSYDDVKETLSAMRSLASGR